MKRLLVANRGEIAARILASAADRGLETVAVTAPGDDAHARFADRSVPLEGEGPAAYMDGAALVAAAEREGCDAIHPGYGFLSERADFGRAVEAAGLVFVGPAPATLEALGDKTAARRLAEAEGVPVLPGSAPLASAQAAERAFAELGGPIALKAAGEGGGRGLRRVERPEELERAFAACRAEGGDPVFAERWLERARHVEVQVAGDGEEARALGTRDCSLQRRHQKVVELAPAPWLGPLEATLSDWAVRMARRARLRSLATFELLVDPSGEAWFLECNPRLQVEHTVTEMVTGLDLVDLQLRLAAGARLADEPVSASRGCALQLRIYAERPGPGGAPLPAEGRLERARWPAGPGVRVDAAHRDGAEIDPRFDGLLAKLVVHAPSAELDALERKARRALSELALTGVETNVELLRELLGADPLRREHLHTGFLDAFLAERHPGGDEAAPAGEQVIRSALAAEVVSVLAQPGKIARAGEELVVLEALKMHHGVVAPHSGEVLEVRVAAGGRVRRGDPLVVLRPAAAPEARDGAEAPNAPDAVDAAEAPEGRATLDLVAARPDLARLEARLGFTLDEARPEAVNKRHRRGHRTARENVGDLCDPGSFTEYGQLAVAAQRRVKSLEALVRETPADGLVAGFGTVNAAEHGPERARTAVLAYDYTVLAGTQGMFNHKKTDRVLEVAGETSAPVVFFCEGGGGRPSDTDFQDIVASTLDVPTFARYASLRGPRIGIAHGPCFAGNAVLFGTSDLTIATGQSFVGMAGPAMVEAGGLGACRVQDLGPIEVQRENGVVDLEVKDEAAAVEAARTLLGLLQGPLRNFDCADQRLLRQLVPEARKRVYAVRRIIEVLLDAGSFVELRRPFGPALIAGLGRLEGRAVALLANDPEHLGGAIDAPAAEKASWLLRLASRFGLPVVSLCDTPGFMVGPEHERGGTVRKGSEMLRAAAELEVPLLTVILRKGYGLGAQAMAGGSFARPQRIVAWPTGELGPMGLEGAVRLAFRKELEAAAPGERRAIFEERVARLYAMGEAMNAATMLEIDAVLDPAETRSDLVRALARPRPALQPRP